MKRRRPELALNDRLPAKAVLGPKPRCGDPSNAIRTQVPCGSCDAVRDYVERWREARRAFSTPAGEALAVGDVARHDELMTVASELGTAPICLGNL